MKEYIENIVQEKIDKMSLLKKCYGEVTEILSDGKVKVKTSFGEVSIVNRTGQKLTVGDGVTIYYWKLLSDGYIGIKEGIQSAGVGKFINSDCTSEVFNDYSVNGIYPYSESATDCDKGFNRIAGEANLVHSDNVRNCSIDGKANTLYSPTVEYVSINGCGNSAYTAGTLELVKVLGDNNNLGTFEQPIAPLSESSIIGCSNSVLVGRDSSNIAIVGNMNDVYITSLLPESNRIVICGSHNNIKECAASGIFGHHCTISGEDGMILYGKYAFGGGANVSGNIMMAFGIGATDSNNAITIDNNLNAAFAGTISSTGQDYAEMFEWEDGNPNAEDRRGLLVTLSGKYIRLAQKGDEIEGIVSAAPSVAGGGDNHEWHGRWKRDIFGEYIFEDVEVEIPNSDKKATVKRPVENPEYDPEQKYIPRSERPEYDWVGYLGRLTLVDDGSCEPNKYVTVGQNGVGTLSESMTNIRCMERIDDTHIRVRIQ